MRNRKLENCVDDVTIGFMKYIDYDNLDIEEIQEMRIIIKNSILKYHISKMSLEDMVKIIKSEKPNSLFSIGGEVGDYFDKRFTKLLKIKTYENSR